MTAIPGAGARILYLDFDGVLHAQPLSDFVYRYFDIMPPNPADLVPFAHMPILEAALQPYPDVQIVLASDWAHKRRDHAHLLKHFPGSLRGRVIDCTIESGFDAVRINRVRADAAMREPTAWLAIDDADKALFPEAILEHFCFISGERGLGDPAAQMAFAAKLAQIFAKGA
jgi:hypothetical protein